MRGLKRLLSDLVEFGLEHLGLYYSKYPGYVVENEDPEGYSRLKLRVPIVSGENTINYWAWPTNVYAGPGYGMQNVPEKGTQVWVEFERGNPNFPLWSFSYHGKFEGEKEKPDELKDIKYKWFLSPGGTLILIDDTEDSEKLTVKLKSGIGLKLSDKGVSLIREGKKIFLGSDEDASEPAVLGDKNEDILNSILSTQQDLAQLLAQISTADLAAATSNGLTYPSLISTNLPNIVQNILDTQSQVQTTKSNNVKLD